MKFWLALILLVFPLEVMSGEFLSYDGSEPNTVLTVRETLSGPVTASILAGSEHEEDNLFESSEIYLRIEGSDEGWWVRTPESYDSMDIIQFINTSHLLITLNTPASTATAVLNLRGRSLYRIGSGAGEVISSNPNDPLIQLNGQRGYSSEVYRYSSITDLRGRVIEFVSSGEACLPISEIVSDEADLSRLQQPLNYCVGVSQ